MNNITLTFSSVTSSLKVRRLLSRENIESKLVKVESNSESGGCVNGVEIGERDLYRAVLVLRENGIEYSVYKARRL